MGTKWDFQSAAQSALALILLALGLMVWDQEGSEPKGSLLYDVRPNVFSRDTLTTINKHLQWTEKQTELNAIATSVENYEYAPSPIRAPPILVQQPLINPFQTEDAAGQVIRDLEPDHGMDSPRLPAERISSLIEQKQWLEKYNRKQTEEFVRAVRENAREAGYQLEINDQLKVTKVKRLPNSITNGGQSGSR